MIVGVVIMIVIECSDSDPRLCLQSGDMRLKAVRAQVRCLVVRSCTVWLDHNMHSTKSHFFMVTFYFLAVFRTTELLATELPFQAQSLPALVLRICTAAPPWEKITSLTKQPASGGRRDLMYSKEIVDLVGTDLPTYNLMCCCSS